MDPGRFFTGIFYAAGDLILTTKDARSDIKNILESACSRFIAQALSKRSVLCN